MGEMYKFSNCICHLQTIVILINTKIVIVLICICSREDHCIHSREDHRVMFKLSLADRKFTSVAFKQI